MKKKKVVLFRILSVVAEEVFVSLPDKATSRLQVYMPKETRYHFHVFLFKLVLHRVYDL